MGLKEIAVLKVFLDSQVSYPTLTVKGVDKIEMSFFISL